ncbi:leucine--tRNA ligase, partial [Candidatus Woesearchaeota archaeon]|nr:leucine--tRNA ligase [Candidatus Woesearchaeota archaeon]
MDLQKIAGKWQARWLKEKAFKSKEVKKQKYYCLEMFPYPSGKMHMGHVRNYSIGDAYARFLRMQGMSVLYPMGWDAFGLPAENAAIKSGAKPEEYTRKCIEQIKAQFMELGLSYDWDRELTTCDPSYYQWNQWLFIQMLEKGLAYRKKSTVNWCDDCGTVLANEQVESGKCWRCENPVSVKELEQWFLKITDYADELLEDIDNLEDWPNSVKIMQKNWIGKSRGTMVTFKQEQGDDLEVFTTRPDTLFGCTFLVIAPENPLTLELVKGTKIEKEVTEFVAKSVRDKEGKEKEGIFLGKHAINPVTEEKIPIYAANFVLMEYGTGAVMSVPAHDQRDYEFAKKYDIPIKTVIEGKAEGKAYMGEGKLVDSGEFTGMANKEAIKKITQWLEKKGMAKEGTHYKLRDWLVSRQRYWGTPIPIVYCDRCGIVPETKLPVKLPTNVKFTGQGNPLDVDSFKKTSCPKCKGDATRETDTMDTFFDSSWYYLRFCDPGNNKEPFTKADYWMPVDQYIGGIEHAILHLLYARFIFKVFRDMGMVKADE